MRGPSPIAPLRRILHIQAGEGARVGIMFVYSAAAMGGVLTVGLVVAESLFMSQLPPSGTPFVFIIPAVSEVLILLAYSRLAARFRLDRLVIGCMVALLIIGVLFRLLLATSAGTSFGTLVALFVYVDAAFTLALGQFWTFAGQIFNTREARRLSGLIALGGRASNVLAGLFLTALVQLAGVANLLFIVIGSLGVCGVCARALGPYLTAPVASPTGRGARPSAPAERASFLQDLRAIRRAPLLRAIVVLALLVSLLLNTGQYQFLLALQHSYAGRSQALAGFLGRFEILAGLAALVVQIAITPRAMSRWGVVAALLFFPLGMALGATICLLTGGVLWAVALTVASIPVFLHTINAAGINVLYLPVPASLRQRAKPLMDGLGAVTFGLAGVVFLLVQHLRAWTYMYWSLPILVLAGAWIALLVWVRRQYVGGLAESISRRRLDVEPRTLDLGDETTVQVLVRALHGKDDLVVAHVLDLLAASPGPTWDRHIATLLVHPSPEIRIMAVRYLGRPANTAYAEPVAALLGAEDDRVRAAAIAALCAIAGSDSLARTAPFLDAPDPLARSAALVGLLTYGGPEGTRRASGRIEGLLAAADPAARQEGVRALTALASARSTGQERLGGDDAAFPYESLLAPLLDDPDRAVRLSAIQAVGALRIHGLLSRLVGHLGEEAAAADALVGFGEEALPALRAALDDPGGDPATRALVPPILQHIGVSAAGTILLDHLTEPDDRVRSAVYRAIARLGATGFVLSPGDGILGARVTDELRGCYAAAAARADLGTIGEDPLLSAILAERQEQARDRVLSLLEIRYPGRGLERVRRAVDAATPDTRAMAIELLDMLVDRTIGELLIPLLEGPAERVVQIARRHFSLSPRSAIEQLESLAKTADPWLRAAAIVRIGTLPAPSLADAVVAALAAEDAVLCEAALAACRTLIGPAQCLPTLHTLAATAPFALVRRFAQALIGDSLAERSPMLSTVERVLFLKVADIFSAVTSEDLVPVAMIAQEVRFSAGETLIRQGSLDDCLYAIVDGDVGIVVRGVGQVAVRQSRSAVGELALLSGRPRSADCVALTDVTALRIDRSDFWELLAEKPSLALGVITMLSQRLDETVRNLSRASEL